MPYWLNFRVCFKSRFRVVFPRVQETYRSGRAFGLMCAKFWFLKILRFLSFISLSRCLCLSLWHPLVLTVCISIQVDFNRWPVCARHTWEYQHGRTLTFLESWKFDREEIIKGLSKPTGFSWTYAHVRKFESNLILSIFDNTHMCVSSRKSGRYGAKTFFWNLFQHLMFNLQKNTILRTVLGFPGVACTD